MLQIETDTWMLMITKVVHSDREYPLQLDGSIIGQWIELLPESAASGWQRTGVHA
jgi:hypothetical protein